MPDYWQNMLLKRQSSYIFCGDVGMNIFSPIEEYKINHKFLIFMGGWRGKVEGNQGGRRGIWMVGNVY